MPCLGKCRLVQQQHQGFSEFVLFHFDLATNLIVCVCVFNHNLQCQVSYFYLVKTCAPNCSTPCLEFCTSIWSKQCLLSDPVSGSYQAGSYHKKNCSSSAFWTIDSHKLQSCWSVVIKYLNWQTIPNVSTFRFHAPSMNIEYRVCVIGTIGCFVPHPTRIPSQSHPI